MSAKAAACPQPWNPAIADTQPYQPGLTGAGSVDRKPPLKMSSNENPAGPSPRVRERLSRCLPDLHRYPEGSSQALKEGLALRHGLSADRVTLGNGSNEALDFLARCFLSPGKNVVCSRHTFSIYGLLTRLCGAELRLAEANSADHAMPFGHNLDAMAEQIDKRTAMVFIANPNNPTGTHLSAAELRAFLRRVPPTVVVVLDQAYIEYADASCARAERWLDRRPNVVVSQTFSKVFALAGLRIGYALSSVSIADWLNRIRQPFNVNRLAQEAALAALSDEDFLRASVLGNRHERERLRSACESLGLRCLPSAANFLCIEFAEQAARVYESLLKRGIVVRPCKDK